MLAAKLTICDMTSTALAPPLAVSICAGEVALGQQGDAHRTATARFSNTAVCKHCVDCQNKDPTAVVHTHYPQTKGPLQCKATCTCSKAGLYKLEIIRSSATRPRPFDHH